MTLEQIYYVGQTISAVAIIGSLLALIAQNYAAQKLVRDAAVRTQVEGLQNISRALFETPCMADVWFRGIGGLEGLSDEDRVKYTAFLVYSLRIWEGLYAQFQHRQLGGEVWRGHIQQLRDVQEFEGVKNVWEARRHTFSDEFQRFYENNLAQEIAQDIYGFREPPKAAPPGAGKLT